MVLLFNFLDGWFSLSTYYPPNLFHITTHSLWSRHPQASSHFMLSCFKWETFGDSMVESSRRSFPLLSSLSNYDVTDSFFFHTLPHTHIYSILSLSLSLSLSHSLSLFLSLSLKHTDIRSYRHRHNTRPCTIKCVSSSPLYIYI